MPSRTHHLASNPFPLVNMATWTFLSTIILILLGIINHLHLSFSRPCLVAAAFLYSLSPLSGHFIFSFWLFVLFLLLYDMIPKTAHMERRNQSIGKG